MRINTKEIRIGSLAIGKNHPIAIQSMTNTRTKDIQKTVEQILSLEAVGCDIVRVAVLDQEDAYAIKEIKQQIHIPLVADIHFDYQLALIAIQSGVDKLRINPGNIGSIDKIGLVVEECKAKNIPIRIGVNFGSMDRDIVRRYGRTAQALVESAKKHVTILEKMNFHNIVVSLKASDIQTTIEAYQLASKHFPYPLHIGITEAGTAFAGTIKSAIGCGILLQQGIGDTLRISLAADPIEEVRVAKEILAALHLLTKPTLIACPTCGRTQYNMLPIAQEIENFLEKFPKSDIKVAVMGCIVNGPGEAMDADIGIAGGLEEALLFKKGKAIKKIKQDEIVTILKDEITALIKEKEEN